jgi:hypothetical protein
MNLNLNADPETNNSILNAILTVALLAGSICFFIINF